MEVKDIASVSTDGGTTLTLKETDDSFIVSETQKGWQGESYLTERSKEFGKNEALKHFIYWVDVRLKDEESWRVAQQQPVMP